MLEGAMKDNASSVTADELVAHSAWLRQLARALASPGSDADDAVQDTYLAALAARPAADRSLRPWLATVLRNVLRRGHRSRVRSQRRERDAVDDHVPPG